MLQKVRIVVCSDVHTEHTRLVAWQNVEFASVKAGDIYIYSSHETLEV